MGVSGSEVTDLGVRYLAGLAPTAQQAEEGGAQGCRLLHTLGTPLLHCCRHQLGVTGSP